MNYFVFVIAYCCLHAGRPRPPPGSATYYTTRISVAYGTSIRILYFSFFLVFFFICNTSFVAPQVRNALQDAFPEFDVVEFLGDGSILSQLETFATASMVVGPHGAGFSNIVVSPLHTPVLEIGPIQCPTCYLNLAVKVRR